MTKKILSSMLLLFLLVSCSIGSSDAVKQTQKITEKNTTSTITQISTSVTAAAKTTTATSTTKAKMSTTKNKTTTEKHTTKESKNTTTTEKKTNPSCTVTIECKSILTNIENLKEGHENYMPIDGYILHKTKTDFVLGNTVYDVLKSVCAKENIILNTAGGSFGVYIAGINNIDERDCGTQSGWLYSVNGRSASKACSKYTVSGGDDIVFTYTCNY